MTLTKIKKKTFLKSGKLYLVYYSIEKLKFSSSDKNNITMYLDFDICLKIIYK